MNWTETKLYSTYNNFETCTYQENHTLLEKNENLSNNVLKTSLSNQYVNFRLRKGRQPLTYKLLKRSQCRAAAGLFSREVFAR